MLDTTVLTQKTAVRFAKTGPAIYHSHHDMIRFWERAVKRADLPMRMTQGFNPHPRIIFPHALGLGISSRHEEVELELYRRADLKDVVESLILACGDTLGILGADNLPPVKKSRQLVESSYRISGWPGAVTELAAAASELLAKPEIIVERGAPKERRTLNIRPYLKRLAADERDACLFLVLGHTAGGSGRPDEIARIVAGKVECDAGDLHIEKTGMVLE